MSFLFLKCPFTVNNVASDVSYVNKCSQLVPQGIAHFSSLANC